MLKDIETKQCLKLVHTDMCGLFSIHAWGGQRYITFIDECSNFGYAYLVHRKFHALDKFVEFKIELNNLLGKHIKALQLDWSGEFVSNMYEIFFLGLFLLVEDDLYRDDV